MAHMVWCSHAHAVLPLRSLWPRVVARLGASTRGDYATTSLTGDMRLHPGRRKKAFKADCTRIWGNLFDYSYAQYKDNHTPVAIRCQMHGMFWMKPRDHIQRRQGCPKCGSLHVPGSLQERAAMMLTPSSTPSHGQHVLRSHKVALEIAAATLRDVEASGASWVAEIGVGAGALTAALLQNSACAGVVGFELDEKILSQALEKGGVMRRYHPVCRDIPESARALSRESWEELLVGHSRCFIFKGDFLTCRAVPSRCRTVVGNIPYRISTAVVSKLLCQEPPIGRLVLTVQAEFARKLLAKPGSLKFDRVSALVQAACQSAQLAIPDMLSPDVFSPPPRVDSAVVLLEPRESIRHQGVALPAAALDQLLRLLLDGVRGPGRGDSLETRLTEVERVGTQILPSSWRVAMARAGVDPAKPAMTMSPEEFVALTAELHSLGFASIDMASALDSKS